MSKTSRQTELSLKLFKAIQNLNEATGPLSIPNSPAIANANPVQPLPGAASAAGANTSPTPQTPQNPAQDPNIIVGSSGGGPINAQGEPVTLDTMINRFNTIRGGKSFSDPEVYGKMTSFYKELSDEDKIKLDNVLNEIGKIIVDNIPQAQASAQSQGMSQPPPGQQQQQAPAAPTAPAAGANGSSGGGVV